MKLELFDYNLPKEQVAQTPNDPRDHSKLLVFDKKTNKIEHDIFCNLPDYLKSDDVLVFNNSKVLPARLIGHKQSGGIAEILLLKEMENSEWEVMIGTRRPKIGLKIQFQRNLTADVLERLSEKTWRVKFNFESKKLMCVVGEIGMVPLPPYIDPAKHKDTKILKKQYQTIYAKKLGSSAAPTAGLHFTERLLETLEEKGVQTEFITLHVGLGTFEPVNTEEIEDYKIHSELVNIDKETAARLIEAKKQGRRIIAVGTTSMRTLEAIFTPEYIEKAPDEDIAQWVDIFIYPGYNFKFVDAIVTNFHLPKSSLLMLISAFIGRETTLKIYNKAIELKYRFFSFGDAMFIK